LKEAMMKMCNPKTQILMKEKSKVPKFEPNEKIRLNQKFVHNNIRLNLIPMPSAAKMAAEGAGTGKSNSDVDAEVMKERSMIIDAVCVRIMKARKVEKHNELIQSIIK